MFTVCVMRCRALHPEDTRVERPIADGSDDLDAWIVDLHDRVARGELT